jgi:hypothetical protein
MLSLQDLSLETCATAWARPARRTMQHAFLDRRLLSINLYQSKYVFCFPGKMGYTHTEFLAITGTTSTYFMNRRAFRVARRPCVKVCRECYYCLRFCISTSLRRSHSVKGSQIRQKRKNIDQSHLCANKSLPRGYEADVWLLWKTFLQSVLTLVGYRFTTHRLLWSGLLCKSP